MDSPTQGLQISFLVFDLTCHLRERTSLFFQGVLMGAGRSLLPPNNLQTLDFLFCVFDIGWLHSVRVVYHGVFPRRSRKRAEPYIFGDLGCLSHERANGPQLLTHQGPLDHSNPPIVPRPLASVKRRCSRWLMKMTQEKVSGTDRVSRLVLDIFPRTAEFRTEPATSSDPVTP